MKFFRSINTNLDSCTISNTAAYIIVLDVFTVDKDTLEIKVSTLAKYILEKKTWNKIIKKNKFVGDNPEISPANKIAYGVSAR